jgi:O-antigen biosynthesis protein
MSKPIDANIQFISKKSDIKDFDGQRNIEHQANFDLKENVDFTTESVGAKELLQGEFEVSALLKQELERHRLELKAAQDDINFIDEQLRLARTRPLRQLKVNFVFHVLRTLSKTVGPIAPRSAARFMRSAKKRDPNRSGMFRGESQKSSGVKYGKWVADFEAWRARRSADLDALAKSLEHGPLISVVVPVYNTAPALLALMIESVLTQRYVNWELCLADDASPNKDVRPIIEGYMAKDSRIKSVFRDKNGHICEATNSALSLATGDYIALLDHDDVLDRDALLYIAEFIKEQPNVKIIYSDEDKIGLDGVRFDPHFKPDWNRDLLYGENYISHLGVYKSQLVKDVGRFRKGLEGSQDYDLLLRCVEQCNDDEIAHIPLVLYHWRASPGSTATSNTEKNYAWDAGIKALQEHLSRQTAGDCLVTKGCTPFTYNAEWGVIGNPLVSIVIPTRDGLSILKQAVESVINITEYKNYEILIVNNGSVQPETIEWFKEVAALNSNVRVLHDNRPFNYSALNNAAVAQANGEFILLLNNDIEVIEPNWLGEMLSQAQRPGVGCVGAKLYYPDGRIQHGGVIIGMGGVADHAHKFLPKDAHGYFCRLELRQNMTAVTAACLMVKKEIFWQVGGLEEAALAVAFNDIDFCLKVREAGYRNIWTPFAALVHHESVSRGLEDTPAKIARFLSEVDYMKRRWRTDIFKDPAYNPNLSLTRNDFSLAEFSFSNISRDF